MNKRTNELKAALAAFALLGLASSCSLVGEGSRNPQIVALDEQSLRDQPAPCTMPEFDQLSRVESATALDYQLAFGCWAKHFEKTLLKVQGAIPGEFNVEELRILARRQLLPLPSALDSEAFWRGLPDLLRILSADGRPVLSVRGFQAWMESLRDHSAAVHWAMRFLHELPQQPSTAASASEELRAQWRVFQGAGKILTHVAQALLPRSSGQSAAALARTVGALWPERARPARLNRLVQLIQLLTPENDRTAYPVALVFSAGGESIEALAGVLSQIAVDRPQKDLTNEGVRTAFDRAIGAWKGFLAETDLDQRDAALMQWPSQTRTPLPVAIPKLPTRSELIRSFFELAEERSTEWSQIVSRYAQVSKQLKYKRLPLAHEFPTDFPILGEWVWGTPIALGNEVRLSDLWSQYLMLLWGESALRLQERVDGKLSGPELLTKISDQWWTPSDSNGKASANEWARTWLWQAQAPALFQSRTRLASLLSLRCDRNHDGQFVAAELECLMPRILATLKTAWMPGLVRDNRAAALRVLDNVIAGVEMSHDRSGWFVLGLLNLPVATAEPLELEAEVWDWLQEELHFPSLTSDPAQWRKVLTTLTQAIQRELVPNLTNPKVRESAYRTLIRSCGNGDSLCLEQLFESLVELAVPRMPNNVLSSQFNATLTALAPVEARSALSQLLNSDHRIGKPVLRAMSRRSPVTAASIEASFDALERRMRSDLR